MRTPTRTHKLAAVLLAALAGQVGLATAASASGGLLGTGLFVPPAPPVTAPPAPAAPAVPTLLQVEQKLADLRFDPGVVDGQSDDDTASAVLAFQKVNGL